MEDQMNDAIERGTPIIEKEKPVAQKELEPAEAPVIDTLLVTKDLAIALASCYQVVAKALANSAVISASDANIAIQNFKAFYDITCERFQPAGA
jgi:hypothetical protein